MTLGMLSATWRAISRGLVAGSAAPFLFHLADRHFRLGHRSGIASPSGNHRWPHSSHIKTRSQVTLIGTSYQTAIFRCSRDFDPKTPQNALARAPRRPPWTLGKGIAPCFWPWCHIYDLTTVRILI